MRTITTKESSPQYYSGMDSLATLKIYNKLTTELDSTSLATYTFAKDLQGPVLEMSTRGTLVDKVELFRIKATLERKLAKVQHNFNQLAQACCNREVNMRSPKQLMEFFYEDLGLSRIFKMDKGDMKLTTDRKALDKMFAEHRHVRPIVGLMLAHRDIAKQIGILDSGVDTDNRFRYQYSIGGTKTGRFSGYESIFDVGSNPQNLPPMFLKMLVADPGTLLVHVDLEQAESRLVGARMLDLFDDPRYLDNCESGDLHTNNAKLVWEHIQSRADAEVKFYRDYTYRYMAKRLGHGSSYGGKAKKMAEETKIPIDLVIIFQERFLEAYEFDRWWQWVQTSIQTTGELITLMGDRRQFFDRLDSDETKRSAIAHDPQSCCAKTNNIGMLQLWQTNLVQLLMQTHDSIDFQVPIEDAIKVLFDLPEIIKVTQTIRGRKFFIPCEIKVGYNMGEYSDDERKGLNLDGLRKWTGEIPARQKEASMFYRSVRIAA